MYNVWRFSSLDLTMFAVARDYKEACGWFKIMLRTAILDSNDDILLDEIIVIERLDREGKVEENESGLEFTEEWLKDIALDFDTISIRC